MALKHLVDSLDGIPEALHGEYKQIEGGKFQLSVEGLPPQEDVAGLKSALQKERERNAQAKQWETLGKTPAEIKEMLDAQTKREEDEAKKKGDFESIRKQDQARFETEKAALQAELTAARSSERQAIVENNLLASLTKAGATQEGADLLPERLQKRVVIETDNGKRIIKITQPDGVTPMAGKGKDGFATFDDLIEEAKTAWPSLFSGSGNGGSGKQPGATGGTGKTIKRADFDALPPTEKAAKMRDGFTVTD